MAEPNITYERGIIYHLALTLLKRNPNQPRKYMDPKALDDLTESVKLYGILVPILVCWNEALGSLMIVAGERRYQAALRAGLETIPAIVVEADNATEVALVENLFRQDLAPVEEAETLDLLIKEQNYTQDKLAQIIGKARNTVSEILSLNKLPQQIRDESLSTPNVARKALIDMARKKQERAMFSAWESYKAKLKKAAAGPTKRTKRQETPDEILTWLSKAVNKLSGIDTADWTEEQRVNFNETLLGLSEAIQGHLSPPEDDHAV